jgi:TPR repeat protein
MEFLKDINEFMKNDLNFSKILIAAVWAGIFAGIASTVAWLIKSFMMRVVLRNGTVTRLKEMFSRWKKKLRDMFSKTPEEQCKIGLKYYESKKYANAVKWYRKSAERGYAEAQYRLGFLYEYGRGVPRDIKEARNWYKKAASQGDISAKTALKYLDKK